MREDAGWPVATLPAARAYDDDHDRLLLVASRQLTPPRAALIDALDRRDAVTRAHPLALAAVGDRSAPHHAHDPLEPHADLPSEVELASLCTDYWPEAVNDAPGLLLGMLGESLSLTDPVGRHALLNCVAAGAMMEARGLLRAPQYVWATRSPEPPIPERTRLRAVSRAPLSLWRIEARSSDAAGRDRAVLVDQLGLHPAYQPSQPVDVSTVAWLAQSGASGSLVAGRVALRSPRDPVLVHGIGLPGPPPAASLIDQWRDEVLLRTWARVPRARVEDALRGRGHAVVCAWAMWWLANRAAR